MATKIEEIREFATAELKANGFKVNDENLLSFYMGLYDTWRNEDDEGGEDPSGKSAYMMDLVMEISLLKITVGHVNT